MPHDPAYIIIGFGAQPLIAQEHPEFVGQPNHPMSYGHWTCAEHEGGELACCVQGHDGGAAASPTAAQMVRAKCSPFHGKPKVFGARRGFIMPLHEHV